jgi:hypothetical protein
MRTCIHNYVYIPAIYTIQHMHIYIYIYIYIYMETIYMYIFLFILCGVVGDSLSTREVMPLVDTRTP